MQITYVVLTHNENQAFELLDLIYKFKDATDQVIALDDCSTEAFVSRLNTYAGIQVVKHKLDYSYSQHRNYALNYCKGNYIFYLDADEIPPQYLLKNIKRLLIDNEPDLVWLPRANYILGLSALDAANLGWRMQDNKLNWPDYQGRIIKNRIGLVWEKNLHEKIKTNNQTVQILLGQHLDYALNHTKTFQQLQTVNNAYLNKYTELENKGLS